MSDLDALHESNQARYQNQVFLHDMEVMRTFGHNMATLPVDHSTRQQAISVLAQTMVDVHGAKPATYERYFSAGIDGEYAGREEIGS